MSLPDPARLEAQKLLEEATEAIAAREGTHGMIRNNMIRTGNLWEAHLGDVHMITADDACVMMALMKLARAQAGDRRHRDHWVDAIGYLALAGGLVLEGDPDSEIL